MTTTRTDSTTKVPLQTTAPRAARGRADGPPTTQERYAAGKAARAVVPRSAHADWVAPLSRPDPVQLLEDQAVSRVPELVPIRYGRMLVSPFTFYRGGAYLMASDLAGMPHTGHTVQLCGDAHLSNFGAYSAPDRDLVFSINDFDETLPGPFEWDVKRLVASFEVAARDRGFEDKERRAINLATVRTYREAMHDMASKRTLDVWYARLDLDEIRSKLAPQLKRGVAKRFDKNVAKARSKNSLKAFDKLVEVVDGQPRLKGDPPLLVPIEDLVPDVELAEVDDAFRSIIRTYRRTLAGDRRHLLDGFRYAGAARKVVGVGSVGTRAWIVLMLGNAGGEPLFLQAKEAQASVLESFLPKSRYANHGQRVVEGQRLMQSASDIMLGWIRASGIDGETRDFYIRQLWDGKGSADIEAMDPRTMTAYGSLCGWTLAHAHARSGDAATIAGYLGKSDTFDRALASFAAAYADQNEQDYSALQSAVETGRVTAETVTPSR